MEIVKLSPKFQVVIPKKIRQQLELHSGQQLQMYVLEGSIRIHPRRSLQELKGSAPNINWKDSYRDREDRF